MSCDLPIFECDLSFPILSVTFAFLSVTYPIFECDLLIFECDLPDFKWVHSSYSLSILFCHFCVCTVTNIIFLVNSANDHYQNYHVYRAALKFYKNWLLITLSVILLLEIKEFLYSYKTSTKTFKLLYQAIKMRITSCINIFRK